MYRKGKVSHGWDYQKFITGKHGPRTHEKPHILSKEHRWIHCQLNSKYYETVKDRLNLIRYYQEIGANVKI